MPFPIDSNVLIDVSRGNAAAIKYVDGLADGLHVFDSLVAATAMEKALTLVTLNRKHYGMIEGLQLEVPGY